MNEEFVFCHEEDMDSTRLSSNKYSEKTNKSTLIFL
jgi:hypothetical protein